MTNSRRVVLTCSSRSLSISSVCLVRHKPKKNYKRLSVQSIQQMNQSCGYASNTRAEVYHKCAWSAHIQEISMWNTINTSKLNGAECTELGKKRMSHEVCLQYLVCLHTCANFKCISGLRAKHRAHRWRG